MVSGHVEDDSMVHGRKLTHPTNDPPTTTTFRSAAAMLTFRMLCEDVGLKIGPPVQGDSVDSEYDNVVQ
jgi:hypothetical protein